MLGWDLRRCGVAGWDFGDWVLDFGVWGLAVVSVYGGWTAGLGCWDIVAIGLLAWFGERIAA
jgi:hypothetical protein